MYAGTLCSDITDHLPLGESNRIRTVPEYGHSRYLRNHKSYKKMCNEKNIHNYKNILKKHFLFFIIQNIADISNKLIFLLRF